MFFAPPYALVPGFQRVLVEYDQMGFVRAHKVRIAGSLFQPFRYISFKSAAAELEFDHDALQRTMDALILVQRPLYEQVRPFPSKPVFPADVASSVHYPLQERLHQ